MGVMKEKARTSIYFEQKEQIFTEERVSEKVWWDEWGYHVVGCHGEGVCSFCHAVEI